MIGSSRVVWTLGVLFLVLLLSACGDQTPATESIPEPTATEPTSAPEPSAMQGTDTAPADIKTAPTATPAQEPDAGGREARLTPAPLPSPERVPVSEPALVTGEVPTDLLEAILQDVEARTGIEAAEMDLLRAETVIWNDGSLGCPQPGVEYTQALVDGYWVVLRAGGKELDYRAAQTGFFVLCEHTRPLPGGATAPTPEQ